MRKDEYIEKYGLEAWEKHRQQMREAEKRYRDSHKEERYANNREWVNNHRECKRKIVNKSARKRYATKEGLAGYRLNAYRKMDKRKGFECTLTREWIITNIFTDKKCVYCGESDWAKLGCDRVDNSKPHTPDNVVCCCGSCNSSRNRKPFIDFFYEKYMESILE